MTKKIAYHLGKVINISPKYISRVILTIHNGIPGTENYDFLKFETYITTNLSEGLSRPAS